jgi:predicted MPP superfamily phosphohydrolase
VINAWFCAGRQLPALCGNDIMARLGPFCGPNGPGLKRVRTMTERNRRVESTGVSRRTVLRWALGLPLATAAAAMGGVGYAYGLEPGWLAVEEVAVRVPDLPPALDGLVVGHLSDLHRGPYTSSAQVRTAVETCNALSPDLVVLTGDYVLYSAEYAASCVHELAALQAPLGVYAISGNHDYWTDIEVVTAELRAAGLTLLRNESWRLNVSGQPLWLAGVDDVLERHHDLGAALANVPRGEPALLLAHEPDFADEAGRDPHRILLQLSGHSHGGQVNLPFLGRPILPPLGLKYPAGLRRVPGSAMQVYTSRGIGVIAPPLRFNCRPEVALLTLERAP